MLIVRLCVCAANCFVSCESTHVHAEEAAAGFNREKKALGQRVHDPFHLFKSWHLVI